MIVKIKILYSSFIKYFTTSTCKLFARLKLVYC